MVHRLNFGQVQETTAQICGTEKLLRAFLCKGTTCIQTLHNTEHQAPILLCRNLLVKGWNLDMSIPVYHQRSQGKLPRLAEKIPPVPTPAAGTRHSSGVASEGSQRAGAVIQASFPKQELGPSGSFPLPRVKPILSLLSLFRVVLAGVLCEGR